MALGIGTQTEQELNSTVAGFMRRPQSTPFMIGADCGVNVRFP
jgi:hypothetical protein